MTLQSDILADLSLILSDWDNVTWNAIIYKGIFHNEYEPAVLFSGEIESREPWVEVREADFSAITHSATITINSVSYKITEIKPSGTGMMILMLSKD